MEPGKRTYNHAGKQLTSDEWCTELGISKATWYLRHSQLRRGLIEESALFQPPRPTKRKLRQVEYEGEKHTVAAWAQKLNITPATFRNRMAAHRRAPSEMPITSVFSPNVDTRPKRSKGGPGRVAKIFQYKHGDKVYAMTANEWSFQLGLSSRDTFYNRIHNFQNNPRLYPLSWVFRCKPNAPWAKRSAQRFAEPAPIAVDEQARILAVVRAELGDINAPTSSTETLQRAVIAPEARPQLSAAGEVAEDVRPKLAPVTVVPDDV